MSKYIKLEDAKVAIREKFKSIEDRIEINNVLNGLPTLNITEYADKHQAYSEGYAKGVVYGGLLKSEVSEEQLSKLQSRENSVENTMVSEDFTSISRANSKLEVSEDCISREFALKVIDDCINYPTNGDKACAIKNAPSVLPKPKEGKRSRCIWCDSPYRIEYNWIDREGNTASFADEDRHLVATGIANYCPNCGMKMKGDKE